MKIVIFRFFLALWLNASIFNVMIAVPEQKKAQEFYSIVMPGQNGGGGETFRQNNIVNTPLQNTAHYNTLQGSTIDMGQGNCIADFKRQYKGDDKAKKKKRLFYGVSQGTATLTNWLAQKTHEQQNKTAKLLVLEGVLGSGNSGIQHTIESTSFALATYLPFSRLWLPFVAKAVFPAYNPLGKQAVSSAKKLSPSLPIVIIHNKGDFQLSINDARKYYCAVKEQGNNNAYLMEVDNGKAHLNVLNRGSAECKRQRDDLQIIYKKHRLPTTLQTSIPEKDNERITKEYQPSIEEVKKRISETNGYSNVMRNVIDFASGALIAAGIWWKYFSKS